MRFRVLHIQFTSILLVASIFFIKPISAQNATFQTEALKPDPAKEAMFLPFLAVRHGGMAQIEDWKKQNTVKYYQELWYYTESFYIKRNHFAEGIKLDESGLDISRFELERKPNEESMVIFQGFKDVLVLIPGNKLIYKPEYIQ